MTSTPARDAVRGLRGRLVAAPATPRDAVGRLDVDVCEGYFRRLCDDGADALAVAVHTGRGHRLDHATRGELLALAAAMAVPVVTGVGGGPATELDADLAWARAAARHGATALLVFPPSGEDPAAVLAHHDAVWQASGLPLVAFDLYTKPYSTAALAAVLEHPGVVAYKPARLYDAIACQEGIRAARERDVVVLTGEDRMLGPSLSWGAEGALVGLAAASAGVTAAVVHAFAAGEHARFLAASATLDELARVTFRPPFDGYVQRMLWIAADEGAIPAAFAVDPDRPAGLDDAEREEVVAVARRCREATGEAVGPDA